MPSTTCKSLLTNKISIRVIKKDERQQVLDFLRAHYYNEEPLTVGFEPKQQNKEDENFNMSIIEYNTCLMAVLQDDAHSQETIVGVILACPKRPDEVELLFKEAAKFSTTKWGQMLQFLGCLEREADIFRRFHVLKVLHVHVIAVNCNMRGQQIGRRLVEDMLSLAKRQNYESVTADCTSFYSQRLFQQIGFDCVNIKYYKDYVNESGKQVFKVEAPHECAKTFALKL